MEGANIVEVYQDGVVLQVYAFNPRRHIAAAQAQELTALADEKDAMFWKALGRMDQGCVLGPASLGRSPYDHLRDHRLVVNGINTKHPGVFTTFGDAYAGLGQFDDARRCIGEAMTAVETTKERWWEAEVHRTAGEIALKSPEPDAAKALAYFERALAVARQQQAKSWEPRTAMSMARL